LQLDNGNLGQAMLNFLESVV